MKKHLSFAAAVLLGLAVFATFRVVLAPASVAAPAAPPPPFSATSEIHLQGFVDGFMGATCPRVSITGDGRLRVAALDHTEGTDVPLGAEETAAVFALANEVLASGEKQGKRIQDGGHLTLELSTTLGNRTIKEAYRAGPKSKALIERVEQLEGRTGRQFCIQN